MLGVGTWQLEVAAVLDMRVAFASGAKPFKPQVPKPAPGATEVEISMRWRPDVVRTKLMLARWGRDSAKRKAKAHGAGSTVGQGLY